MKVINQVIECRSNTVVTVRNVNGFMVVTLRRKS